jgi:hypothetical protein
VVWLGIVVLIVALLNRTVAVYDRLERLFESNA